MARSQFFISAPPGPFFPCFVVLARFDSRNFWNGVLRVVSNSPAFHAARSMRILRSRRCSAGGCSGNSSQSLLGHDEFAEDGREVPCELFFARVRLRNVCVHCAT